MNFYVSIFKGNPAKKSESKIESIIRYPSDMQVGPDPGMAGKVLTAVFVLEGQRFMALDGGPIFKPTSAMSLYVECQNQEEVDYFWEKLSEGGDPKAQECGWLMDKFGFSWQVIPSDMGKYLGGPDRARANKATAAMLKMKKIIIADLEKAYNS